MRKSRVPVYVIVRIDGYVSDLEDKVTIQSVLSSLEEARSEVLRLNALPGKRNDVSYFCRTSRFYPNGRGHDEANSEEGSNTND
jgi:hypothetical protein